MTRNRFLPTYTLKLVMLTAFIWSSVMSVIAQEPVNAVIADNTVAVIEPSSASQVVQQLRKEWAIANYQRDGKAQKNAFEALLGNAEHAVQAYPEQAEVLVWRGIIKSTYAGIKGGLSALSLAKSARRDFEQSLQLDSDVMKGAAYTSLGTLYFNVPGWPLGFGNDRKAEELLQQGLKQDPAGIDSNYFYARYLINEKRFSEARRFLLKARLASPRAGREIADAGRQKEIDQALALVADKLS